MERGADAPGPGVNGWRKKALGAAVVSVGGFLVVSQLSGSGSVTAQSAPPPEPAATLECPPGDLVFTLNIVKAAGAPASPSPEAAVAREIASLYRNLPPEAFRRARATSHAVEMVHERQGRRLAGALVERLGEGWAVESFSACNSLLRQGRGR